jgi:hypothetical protein
MTSHPLAGRLATGVPSGERPPRAPRDTALGRDRQEDGQRAVHAVDVEPLGVAAGDIGGPGHGVLLGDANSVGAHRRAAVGIVVAERGLQGDAVEGERGPVSCRSSACQVTAGSGPLSASTGTSSRAAAIVRFLRQAARNRRCSTHASPPRVAVRTDLREAEDAPGGQERPEGARDRLDAGNPPAGVVPGVPPGSRRSHGSPGGERPARAFGRVASRAPCRAHRARARSREARRSAPRRRHRRAGDPRTAACNPSASVSRASAFICTPRWRRSPSSSPRSRRRRGSCPRQRSRRGHRYPWCRA